MVDSRYPSHLLSLHLLLASSRFYLFFSNSLTRFLSFIPLLFREYLHFSNFFLPAPYSHYRSLCHLQTSLSLPKCSSPLAKKKGLRIDPVQGLQLSSVMYTLTGLPTRFTIITGVCAFVGFSLLILLSISPNCFQVRMICMMSVSIKISNFEKVLGPNRWTIILDILNLNGIRWIWGGLLIFLHQEPFSQLNNHNSSHILLDSVLREASCANCWRHLWPKKGVRVIKKLLGWFRQWKIFTPDLFPCRNV